MSTSSGRKPWAAKSSSSSPHGISGAGFGPSPVSTAMVRPSDRMTKQAKLKRTFPSGVKWLSWPRQSSPGIAGKKLHRSNSSRPSERDVISTLPIFNVFPAISSLLAMGVARPKSAAFGGDYRLPAPWGQSSWTRTAPGSGWRRTGRICGAIRAKSVNGLIRRLPIVECAAGLGRQIL